jgi:protein-S-isoprenylcysteine O-methyltransferase Ste14
LISRTNAGIDWAQFVLFDRLLPAGVFALLAWPLFWGVVYRYQKGTSWYELGHQGTRLLFTVVVALLLLIRRRKWGQNAAFIPRLIALIATFLPLVTFRFLPQTSLAPKVLLTSMIVSWLGLVWMVVALAYLGRCFGLFPEVRGLVTRGPYGWVRHPLYLGEMVMVAGLLLPLASPLALLLFVLIVVLQIMRTFYEEQALLRAFPQYRDYMTHTRRLLPGIW